MDILCNTQMLLLTIWVHLCVHTSWYFSLRCPISCYDLLVLLSVCLSVYQEQNLVIFAIYTFWFYLP